MLSRPEITMNAEDYLQYSSHFSFITVIIMFGSMTVRLSLAVNSGVQEYTAQLSCIVLT